MQATRSVLQSALSYHRILADAMPLLVMMADPDGTVTFFNRRWFEYTGQTRFDRDIDRDWTRYLHADDAERVANDWMQAAARGDDVIDMEYRLREAGTGLYRWMKARATAVRDESGQIVQWVGTAMDIDDARRTSGRLAEIAEAYQSASLPALEPAFNGLRFSVAYRASARHLTACGDWYDAFSLDDGRIAICIGDVGGHGLQAATLMMKYRQSFRALALPVSRMRTEGPETILAGVEDAIAQEHQDANATAFFGIIDPQQRTLRWSCAGHLPPLLVKRDGSTQWLASNEPPLGWRFGVTRTTATTDLHDVQHLILYTDGLVEASRNLVDGMAQLEERALSISSDEEAAVRILESWTPPAVQDDVAILVISF